MRAELHAREGEYEAGWRDIAAVCRLGEKIAEHAPMFFAGRAAYDRRLAIERWHAVLTDVEADADTLKRYSRKIAGLPQIEDIAFGVDVVDRAVKLDILAMIARNPNVLSGYPDRHEAYERVADFFIYPNVYVSPEDARTADWPALFALVNQHYDHTAAIFKAKGVDRLELTRSIPKMDVEEGDSAMREFVIFELINFNYRSLAQLADTIENGAAQGIFALSLAVQAYEVEQGELPEDLAALVPGYLDAIPIDPFDDEPLRYAQRENGGFKIWSVGRDRTDDGGLIGDSVLIVE